MVIKNIQKIFTRLWLSPTFSSWGCTLARTLGFFLIMPLVLTTLTTEEIALWYLFATLMGLQLIVDMGFNATFSRVIAFAMGGASDIRQYSNSGELTNHDGPNWMGIERIYGTMSWLYARLSVIWLILLFCVGTWSSSDLIHKLEDPSAGWAALFVVVASSAWRLYGTRYSATLLGLHKVALLKRWETLIWICVFLANLAVLLLGGGVFWLVVSTQGLIFINVWVNRRLCHLVEGRRILSFKNTIIDKKILHDIWPKVWRSGVGILMSAGVVQGSGVIYARLATPEEVASYLLALNLIRVIAQFAQAPFYSKLPKLARLMAEGKLKEQVTLAKRGMKFSYWVLVSGVLSVSFFGDFLLEIIDSKVAFVESGLWSLIGIAAYLERFGAMHLQLYSTTNHIIWHVANGVTGLIYLVILLPLFYMLGVYSFPVSQIISNLLFYDWYCAQKSYGTFSLTSFDFEKRVSLIPIVILCVFSVVLIIE
ncbi:MAG: hypothetical protein P8X74_21450 [Reinekea sp.]